MADNGRNAWDALAELGGPLIEKAPKGAIGVALCTVAGGAAIGLAYSGQTIAGVGRIGRKASNYITMKRAKRSGTPGENGRDHD